MLTGINQPAQKQNRYAKQFVSRLIWVMLVLGHAQHAQAHFAVAREGPKSLQQVSTRLEPGRVIERELKGDEVHSFQISLIQGQFLYAVIEQKSKDVVVTMFDTEGRQLFSVDSPNGSWGAEPAVMVAEASGEYRLEVRPANIKAPDGRYVAKIIALRQPAAEDRDHVAAQRIFEEAEKLRLQRTAATRRAAIENYGRALSLFQSARARAGEALTLYALAFAHAELSEFRDAIEFCNRALPIFRASGDSQMQRFTLSLMGGAYDLLGDLDKALDHHRQALGLARASGNQSSEASALNNIGTIYDKSADWQKALDYYIQALPLFRVMKDRRQANTLHNIGSLYVMLGDLEKALDYLQEAVSLWRAAANKAGEANTLNSIGYVYFLKKDFSKALDYHRQALGLWQTAGDRTGEASTLDNIGIVHSALDQAEKAIEYHQQALVLQREAENRRGEAISLGNIGYAHILSGRPQKAKQYSEQALSSFKAMGDNQNQATMLYHIARAERDLGNLAASRLRMDESLRLIETVRGRTDDRQLRASYFASRQDAYEFYIDLMMRLHKQNPAEGHNIAALQISERARARSLVEQLREARGDIKEGVDANLLIKERNLAQLLNAKTQQQVQLLGQKNAGAQLAALNKEIGDLEDQYQQAQSAIRKASPRYAAITQPQPLDAKAIQQLLDKDTLLLEYSIGDERSYLWAVTADSINSYELPRRELIKKAARRVYDLMTARSLYVKNEAPQRKRERINNSDNELPQALAALSQMILAPAASELGGKRLVIAPDGELQQIPFAALPAPHLKNEVGKEKGSGVGSSFKRLLISEHEIISIPSASTLAEHRKSLAGRKPADRAIAVIADPVFSSTDERLKARADKAPEQVLAQADSTATRLLEHVAVASGKGAVIPRLPFTGREAEEILAITPSSPNLKAVDFKASREIATSPELARYRYLHFATHGYLDIEHPDRSAIVLSMFDEQGKPQPGLLTATEIYNLKLPAELVVLSACETGLGKEFRGEGLWGLTRAFMYAGAARVIVSLWSVNDKATSELMSRFYKAMLKDRQAPAAALRSAQADMLKQKQWREPYYWAAFTLQGEWK